ncbi:MAG: FMN-binding protein [Chitinispirillales bacterium]|jgi:electron transport complex protein RnfG|nr:FMN-binding protein [Chitinispirillales bacterium]
MVEMAKMIVALAIISALAGLAIGAAYDKTAEKISEQEKSAKASALKAVFPQGAAIDTIIPVIPVKSGGGLLPEKYWTAMAKDALVGYAFEMSGRGYASDDIKFIVGVDREGKILGMTVLSHNETPGLGSRVNEVASTRYVWYPVGESGQAKPWFTEQFEGLSSLKPIGINKVAGEWHGLDEPKRAELRGKNEVTAITGSTISTRAFTNSISRDIAGYVKELSK